ncbi:putative Intron-binding protein aquarius N-terminus [Blattamonas nauphoetae]|uniref:Intron-binding protein aquarius N-terminus n=1 Tax=Blattamonas nauphoetae TaxID=2049346 RepID=A0ABQ9XJZ3_9EUKA|nr:putative Intron-binding protein aquarius N-terminus [Blattamonas nauphoetae]
MYSPGLFDVIGTDEDKGDVDEESGKLTLSSKVLIELIAEKKYLSFQQNICCWDTNFLPTSTFRHEHILALQKLSLQYLLMSDYLLHNYTLFRYESTHTIREDLEGMIEFTSQAPTALPIGGFNLTVVGREKVGKSCPSFILSEFDIGRYVSACLARRCAHRIWLARTVHPHKSNAGVERGRICDAGRAGEDCGRAEWVTAGCGVEWTETRSHADRRSTRDGKDASGQPYHLVAPHTPPERACAYPRPLQLRPQRALRSRSLPPRLTTLFEGRPRRQHVASLPVLSGAGEIAG